MRGEASTEQGSQVEAETVLCVPGQLAQAHGRWQGGASKCSIQLLRRNFWLVHMAAEFPHLSEAASRLLSAHVTSCATERNWSLFGNIFTKTRNRLALARAQDIAFVRANNSLGGRGSADEEVMPSIYDLIEEEGENNMVE